MHLRTATRFAVFAPVAAVLTLGLGGPGADADEPPFANQPAVQRDEATTKAIKAGLEQLAKTQNANGSWNCRIGYKLNQTYRGDKVGSHVGATGVAGMAFLANGHVPGRGKYGDVVSRAVGYILERTEPSGYITDNQSRMYSHAFAGLFLAEVYGMTQRTDVKLKLNAVVELMVQAQKQNASGAWRYDPISKDADLSLTVCQLQMLRAAMHAGIRVPKGTIDRAQRYVNACMYKRRADDVRFYYQDQGGSRTTYALTAAGIVSLYSSGAYEAKELRPAVNTLWRLKEEQPFGSFSYFYGHYYGVQAFYQDGRYWNQFWPHLRKSIVQQQQSNGGWVDRVDPTYATAMATLILSIPNGYLPIFQR
ncbi:MAG: prenyltransferase/squalene oxidase repeat-containing protein [Planctomycetota bacterium]|jgi:hypothetical protein